MQILELEILGVKKAEDMGGILWNAIRAPLRASRLALRSMAFCFAMFFTACVWLPIAAQAQDRRFDVIDIQGAVRIEPATVLSYAGIREGDALTAGQLNAAYQRVLDSGLFESVEFTPSGSTLIIAVNEFPTINRIRFEGNKRLGDEDLEQIIQSSVRRVYSPSLVEQDAARIIQAYEQTGRLAANVDPVIIRRSNNRVDLIFEVREGSVVEVERISFIGNRDYTDRRLRRVLQSKQAGLLRNLIRRDTFIADRIEFDEQVLSDFYLSRGYVDFQILSATSEFSRERNAFFVTFNIREGQRFAFGKTTVSSDLPEIDPEVFEAEILIREGQTYGPNWVDNTIERLERLAIQQGFNFVRAEPRVTRNDRELTLDIDFALVRGPRIFIERIDIKGNATTLDRVIRRQFTVVEGDPFNPREIRDSAARIRALGFFSRSNVESRDGTEPGQVIIEVDVEEQPTGSLGFGASYNIADGVGFNINFSERNFLGRGQSLGFEFSTTSDSNVYSFRFGEPAFLGRDLAFGIAASYAENTSVSNTTFNTQSGRFSTSLEWPVSEFGRLGVNYTLNASEVRNVPPPPKSSVILQSEALRGQEVDSSFGYLWRYRTLSGGLNPDAGISFRWSQDFAGAGGDNEFIKSEVFIVGERKVLNDDVTLRAIFRGGVHSALGDLPSRVTDRYSLNGIMRGFDTFGLGPRDLGAENNDPLGGNYFSVVKFETEFPLGLPEEYGISGGVFLDAGSVWDLDEKNGTNDTLIDDGFHPRAAAGISIFWTTQIGPLRFNFSRVIEKQSYDIARDFDLTISTRF